MHSAVPCSVPCGHHDYANEKLGVIFKPSSSIPSRGMIETAREGPPRSRGCNWHQKSRQRKQLRCLWEGRCEDCVCIFSQEMACDTLVQYAACLTPLPTLLGRERGHNSIPITLVWDGASLFHLFHQRRSLFSAALEERSMLVGM